MTVWEMQEERRKGLTEKVQMLGGELLWKTAEKEKMMEKWKSRKEVKLVLKEEKATYISKIPYYFLS